MPKLLKITLAQIEELFNLYQEGQSLRQLEKRSGISYRTLLNYFNRHYPNHSRPQYGITPILREYLESNLLLNRQKQELTAWIQSNRSVIAASDERNIDTPLYKENQIDAKSSAECSYWADWREFIVDRTTDI